MSDRNQVLRPNITGELSNTYSTNPNADAFGALYFKYPTSGSRAMVDGTVSAAAHFCLDASKTWAVYKNSGTVSVPAVLSLVAIRF